MEWKQLLRCQRLGKDHLEDSRSERTAFLRDYDRLVYSTAFRRLKDKTQVFPLAKKDDIRTRLIHSLEVSCVGRSLGRIVGEQVIQRHRLTDFEPADFGDILSAACLAHDIGNPPYGHAGEDALQTGFQDWYGNFKPREGQNYLDTARKADLDHFEGNAQGFRILTRLEIAHRRGGMQLTCPTLATFAKYPRESFIPAEILNGYDGRGTKKYGFFQAEKELFTEVAETVGLIRRHPEVAWWARHPLAFLLEAADDICYSIVDLEDGFRMGYIPFADAGDLLNAIADVTAEEYPADEEETIKRLRAKAIDRLVREIAEIFLDLEIEILAGTFDRELLASSRHAGVLGEIERKTRASVFLHPNVVRIKLVGYEVLGFLFQEFANTVFYPSKKGELMLYMLPPSYRPNPIEDTYDKLLKITDYLAGLTDFQATGLFQQLKGISL
ncbi:dNTP triphosphohydrolase [Pannus brasiliensis CCIBt3594]|uniref:DNTP triphosphohydrolase n=1 Tax=Pannus brasiliensis CCIBt3594 TaxID=1427578 RepID=A0AAW9QSS9_9CHRO